MKVIVFASRKGGAGKTTLASHVAVEACRTNAGQIVVVDTDPMGGLAGWWNARSQELEGPHFVTVGKGGLRKTLDELEKVGTDYVIIDTPPAANASMSGIIGVADLVVVPVTPSPNDLRAIGETLDMIESQGRPMVFVVNNAATNTKTVITHEASAELSQHGRVCPVIVRTRQDFRTSMTDGRTAPEIAPKSKSVEEIAGLWSFVQKILKKEEVRGRQASSAK